MSTPKSVIELAKKQGAKMVDVKFVDTFGTWQHFSVPIVELTEEVFEEGFGFDGSSIRGWKSIEASDMLAMPDPNTAFIDPFCNVPTLSLTCTIAETGTREAYNRDPRGIARRKIPSIHRHRRYCLLRPGSGIFHFRQHSIRSQTERNLLFDRLRRRHLEQRPRRNAESRLQNPLQGRLFPGRAY
jgi:glutamine synthetase